jgi:ATP-binding cassette subfamily F protein 3
MIRLKDVTLHRGAKRVLSGASLTLHGGWKVGVVGANGAGKSSLLGLLAGRFTWDAGELERTAGQRVAEVAQDVDVGPGSLLDFVLDGDPALRELERAVAAAEAADDGERLAGLLARYEDMDGYTADARAARILGGLGFPAARHGEPLASFSGGWRVRAALARALAQPSDVLLLDEPTNHLDLDAVVWLEDWLRAYQGTLLLVSHDREFLDAVVDHVVHVQGGAVTLYTGDYTFFEGARAEALAQQARAFERQQRDVARIHRFVERFRYKATKARQAQSRLKALERMERIAPAHVEDPFRFAIAPPERLPSPLVTLDGAAAGYGGPPVVSAVDLALVPGQRVGILGRNGAGKSTLVKLVCGDLAPSAGRRTAHGDLTVGYFAQHQVEQLRDDESALAHVQREAGLGEQGARDLLGRYGFSGDDALRAVGTCSGGERARLVLALVFQRRPNLLLLDEPTNHLDLDMRHALSVALQEYPGAIVLVSHDRHLLRATADELWLVRDGGVSLFDGDLEDYARWLRRSQAAPAQAAVDSTPARSTPPGAAPGPAARPRKLSYKEQRELSALPQAIERLEREQAALQAKLADPALYRETGEHVAEVREALSRVERTLEGSFARWDELEAIAQGG